MGVDLPAQHRLALPLVYRTQTTLGELKANRSHRGPCAYAYVFFFFKT